MTDAATSGGAPSGAATSSRATGTAASEAQPHAEIRALLRAGRNDEAIARLCRVIVTAPADLVAKQILFDAFFQKRDWEPALVLAEELSRHSPDNAQAAMFVVATLGNMRRVDDTIARAQDYLKRFGEHVTVLDALKVAYFCLGQVDTAVRYGQRALELRDAEACRGKVAAIGTPATPPQGRDVIAFSLWGNNPCHVYGAMINFVLSRSIYPGWTCRFYVDRAVPKGCIAFLKDNGAEIRAIEDEYPAVGLFQRFLVMNDKSVGRFLVRDCDGRLTAGEAALVRAWIDSGEPFHAIRDHVLHNVLMVGGLWGGRTDCGIDIVELMRRYFTFGPTAKYGHDQRMLALMLWPLIRGHCLVHDKHYQLPGVRTVKLTDPKSHFGAGHQNLAAVREEVRRLGLPKVE